MYKILMYCPIIAVLFFLGCAGKPKSLDTRIPVDYTNFLDSEAEELVRMGINCHDRGDYKAALDYYGQAMGIAPDHPVIYYEMGFSYIAMGEYDSALEMAEKGIAGAKLHNNHEVIPSLLDLKGSALDNLDRKEDAVNVYLEAINEYGVSNTFLYYNLGVTYYRINKREEAVDAFCKGLLVNPNHAGSNFLLGKISMEDGKTTQAFYALCYFLLLEPNTDRSAQSYNTVLYMLEKKEEGIGVRDNGSFTPADMIISTAFALDEENARMSDKEKTQAKLRYIFTNLEVQKNLDKISRSAGDELWWDFYAPFFYRITNSGYFDIFCRYIGLTTDPNADDWIENGRNEIEGFFEWLNAYSESSQK